MPKGGKIGIEADVVSGALLDGADATGSFIRLRVTDTGEGMDAATLAKASEPFFTTKGVGKGTGLGLSMVHGIAQQSGGRLVLTSTKNVGTTAEIWLPAATEQTAAVQHSVIEPLPSAAPQRRLNILAVDDDYLILLNTSTMLEDLGHTVVEASSAEEALEAFEKDSFDLIITDHAMPRTTGAQLAERILADRPQQAIILATGYDELPDGSGDHLPKLSKPFSQQQLEAIILEVMR